MLAVHLYSCVKDANWGERTSSATCPSVRVAVIHNRQDLRDALAALISATDGLAMAGQYRSVEDALPNMRRERPEIALIAIGLPALSGIEGIRRLRSSHPEVLPPVLSGRGDDERVFDALCAGALGYLTKDTAPAQLIEAIREVVSGGSPLSPGIARRVVRLVRLMRPPSKADYGLSVQQAEDGLGTIRSRPRAVCVSRRSRAVTPLAPPVHQSCEATEFSQRGSRLKADGRVSAIPPGPVLAEEGHPPIMRRREERRGSLDRDRQRCREHRRNDQPHRRRPLLLRGPRTPEARSRSCRGLP